MGRGTEQGWGGVLNQEGYSLTNFIENKPSQNEIGSCEGDISTYKGGCVVRIRFCDLLTSVGRCQGSQTLSPPTEISIGARFTKVGQGRGGSALEEAFFEVQIGYMMTKKTIPKYHLLFQNSSYLQVSELVVIRRNPCSMKACATRTSKRVQPNEHNIKQTTTREGVHVTKQTQRRHLFVSKQV